MRVASAPASDRYAIHAKLAAASASVAAPMNHFARFRLPNSANSSASTSGHTR